MSERGVFAVDRGIWDHDLLASSDPFSRREAWLWIVSEAAWRPHRRRITGKVFDLARGQLVASTRFIAAKWNWSEPRVRRFLAALISDCMIDAKTDAGVTVITVCKYDEYQRVSLPSDATPKDAADAGATQERRKVEDKENKEKDSEPKGSAAHAPTAKPVYTDSRHELFGEGVPILVSFGVADRKARSMIGSWLKQTFDDAQDVLGAIQRARDHRPADPIPWITQSLRSPNAQRPRYQNGKSASDNVLAAFAEAAGCGPGDRERPDTGQGEIPLGRLNIDG